MTSVVGSGPVEGERKQNTLRARIHRGADEIGGSCVEVAFKGSRLVLDIGRPLTAERGEFVPLPPVAGLADGDPSICGVLLSHGHQDHWGLIDQVHSSIPVYVGRRAADVMRAAQFWGSGIDLHESGHFTHHVPIQLGPFTVTPSLVDHSGFDAYSFVIEAGGRRLMYSGDFRAHGRKASLFEDMVAHPPAAIDALLLEGTLVGQSKEGHGLASEAAVENELASLCEMTSGAVVTLSSAQNIDRVVSCYRAALRSARDLVLDLYTAEVMAATALTTIPRPGADWPRVKVFMPVRQRLRVRDSGQFGKAASVRDQRIFPEQLAANPGRYLLVGSYQGEIPRMIRHGILNGGCVVWSLWDGYLNGASGEQLTSTLDAARVPLVQVHTSGHASPTDLQRLVAAVRPEAVVPIHTERPEAYGELLDAPVAVHPNGEWWAA